MTMTRDDYAVVIGISTYPGLENLDGPENDAQDFAAWLKESANLDEARLDLILSSQFVITDDPATIQPVVSTIDRVFGKIVSAGRRAADRKLGRRLTIFLAGHGFTGPDRADSALLTAEATEDDIGFHIPGRTYAEAFVRAGFFEEVVLFVDACADAGTHCPLRSFPWGGLDNPPSSTRWFYAMAASWGQFASERKFPAGGKANGLFTKALLEGLNGAAASNSGVTSTTLQSYLIQRLSELQIGENDRQDPFFSMGGDLFFSDLEPPLFDVIVFRPGWPPIDVIDLKTMRPIESSGIGSNWSGSLPRGIFLLRENDGGYRQGAFEVKSSCTVDSEAILSAVT
jgi:hypothetical protein